MIQIRLSELLLLCMIPGLLSIVLWWARTVWREHQQDRLHREAVIRCRICGCAYPAPETEGQVSHCPSCKSANLAEPQRLI
jgi:predicted Zn-ribbon and HTH transcriptional regulator